MGNYWEQMNAPATLPNDPQIQQIEYGGSKTFIRMCGETVCVRWNGKSEKQTRMIEGIAFTGEFWHPVGQPFIDFVIVQQNDDDAEPWLDEDSPVDGGLCPKEARRIAAELLVAADYLDNLTKKE